MTAEERRDVPASSGARGGGERRSRYAAALASARLDAVLAVADEETAELRAEVERLRRWKEEAIPVMDGLQELGQALHVPLGGRITGRQTLDAALDLRNETERVRSINESLTTANINLGQRVRDRDGEITRLRTLVETEREIGDEIDRRLSAERDALQRQIDRVRARAAEWRRRGSDGVPVKPSAIADAIEAALDAVEPAGQPRPTPEATPYICRDGEINHGCDDDLDHKREAGS